MKIPQEDYERVYAAKAVNNEINQNESRKLSKLSKNIPSENVAVNVTCGTTTNSTEEIPSITTINSQTASKEDIVRLFTIAHTSLLTITENSEGFLTPDNLVTTEENYEYSDLTKNITTQSNPYDQKSMDFSDSKRNNPFNQIVSHLNSQFDNVKSSFDDMYLKDNIAK